MYSRKIVASGLAPEKFDSFDFDDESGDPIADEHPAIYECADCGYLYELCLDLFQGHISTVSHFSAAQPGNLLNGQELPSHQAILCMVLLPRPIAFEPYLDMPMPLSRLQLLMQFRMGSHSLPVEQGRLARPMVPRQLRRCTLYSTGAIGNERHYVFDCSHFAHIRRHFRSLFLDADGAVQSFMWHRNQKAVCHCLAAILNLADDSSMDTSS